MAKAAGMNVGVGGNIGLPALMLLDKAASCMFWSFPASSWKPPPACRRWRRRSST
jgi:UDP-N-acetylmuramoylalanine--D-glutamate ligase